MNLPTQPSAGAAATYWFVAVGSQRKGPFSEVQLQAMINLGAVTRTSLVWCTGMPTWATAESTALSLLFDIPPPLPVAPDDAATPIEQKVAAYRLVEALRDTGRVAATPIEHQVVTSNVSPALSAAPVAGQSAQPSVATAELPAREAFGESEWSNERRQLRAKRRHGEVEAIGESEWSSKPRPWMRYFARTIDITCGGIVLGLTLGWLIPPQLLENTIFVTFASTILTMLIEPVLLSTWGWTPGKSLLCVRVRGAGGVLMSTSEGYVRSWAVALRGMGFAVPIVSLITMNVGYNRLTKHGITTWDEQGQFTVTHRNPGWVRGTVAVLVVIAIFASTAYLNAQRR